ncbi:MAG: tRNA (guanosine(37)-N1)-methyltransferase TrmD, partial [Lactobacillus delbrueckii]
GQKVPEVLLSGNHGKIDEWRHYQALKATKLHRPDLLEKRDLTPEEVRMLRQIREDEQAEED